MRLDGPICRMVVLGDIHGRHDLLAGALAATGLAEDGRWTGGTSVLIQTGDLADRGPHGLRCMETFMSLETQAREAGGHALAVLGNHELMALACSDETNDHGRAVWMRNGAPELYREWVEREGLDPSPALAPAFHGLFGPGGVYGRWLMTRPAAAVVDDLLVTHAGMDGDLTVDDLCREVEKALAGLPAGGARLVDPGDPVFGDQGPFWRRGLDLLGVETVCLREGVGMQAIGHTPSFGLSGRVLNVDAGMVYTGTWQAAVREEGWWWVYSGARPPVPLVSR